jgi:hypothetical protein
MLAIFDLLRSLNSSNLTKSNNINETKETRENLVIKFAKDIKYFDFIYENFDNFSIVNVERHVFYCDLYIFVDCLKNLTREFVKKQRIREFVSSCLREKSLI